MSTELVSRGLSYNLPIDTEQVIEAEKKNKSNYPNTQNGVAFVCTRIVESAWVNKHPMDHTNGKQFKFKIDRYVELLYSTVDDKIAKNEATEARRNLEERLKDMLESLKATIKVKHFDLLGTWQKRYGLGRYNGNISWGKKQEEIVHNMKRAVDTLHEVGHEGFQYSVEDYDNLYEQYKTLVRKGYVTSNSTATASKNQLKDELDELLRCIMHGVKFHHPKDWESVAIDIGFLKVRN